MKRALITGITGQDGSYLSELLLEKGWEVYGLMRRASTFNTERIDHLLFPEEKINLVYGDLAEEADQVLYDLRPDVVFNLAAMSHVRVSFDTPIYTMDVNAIGPLRLLEAIRKLGLTKKTRFYQASSSEMFGMSPPPQNEETCFHPCSPYGAAKLAAYWLVRTYRDGYGIHATNGILHNHESPRRGKNFVTAKIVDSAVRIKLGLQKELVLGNLEAKRDWGHSKDYMRAIFMMMEHDTPGDWLVATHEIYSVKEFLIKVFEKLDMDWEKYVRYDSRYTRPKEVPALQGDPTKIKKEIGWEPEITVQDLIDEMIECSMKEHRSKL